MPRQVIVVSYNFLNIAPKLPASGRKPLVESAKPFADARNPVMSLAKPFAGGRNQLLGHESPIAGARKDHLDD